MIKYYWQSILKSILNFEWPWFERICKNGNEYNFRKKILEQQEILGCFIHIQVELNK